jgi:hypothetical protein
MSNFCFLEKILFFFYIEFFDSYKEDGKFEPRIVNKSRIGDEYYFVSNLLYKLANLNKKCKNEIEKTLETLEILKTCETKTK